MRAADATGRHNTSSCKSAERIHTSKHRRRQSDGRQQSTTHHEEGQPRRGSHSTAAAEK